MTKTRLTITAAFAFLGLAGPGLAHDYPTEAIGDYLFACMASNGQTQDALQKCACSIDVIGSIISHEDYASAETFMSMRQVRGGGEKMALFRETKMAKEAVDKLKRAQVEAEIRCF
ncbi:MAG: hypothetical protein ACR2QJ_04730 [Geminicoccaceae bacterium]